MGGSNQPVPETLKVASSPPFAAKKDIVSLSLVRTRGFSSDTYQPLVGDVVDIVSVAVTVGSGSALVVASSVVVVVVGSGSALVVVSSVLVVVGSGSGLDVETVVVVTGSGSAEQVLVDSGLRHSTADMAALLILTVASLGSLRLVCVVPCQSIETRGTRFPVHTR